MTLQLSVPWRRTRRTRSPPLGIVEAFAKSRQGLSAPACWSEGSMVFPDYSDQLRLSPPRWCASSVARHASTGIERDRCPEEIGFPVLNEGQRSLLNSQAVPSGIRDELGQKPRAIAARPTARVGVEHSETDAPETEMRKTDLHAVFPPRARYLLPRPFQVHLRTGRRARGERLVGVGRPRSGRPIPNYEDGKRGQKQRRLEACERPSRRAGLRGRSPSNRHRTGRQSRFSP